MASEEMVEGGEVAGLLSVHVLHHGTEMWVGFYYGWSLGRVYSGCGEFAGLVDAELEEFNGWVELGRGLEAAYGAV